MRYQCTILQIMINPFLYSRSQISHQARLPSYKPQEYVSNSRFITQLQMMKPTSLLRDDYTLPSSFLNTSQLSTSNSQNHQSFANGRVNRQNPFLSTNPSRFLKADIKPKEGGLTDWERRKYLRKEEQKEQLITHVQQIAYTSQYQKDSPQTIMNSKTRNKNQVQQKEELLQRKSKLKSTLSFTKPADLDQQDLNNKYSNNKQAIQYSDSIKRESSDKTQPFQIRRTLSEIRQSKVENAAQQQQFPHDRRRSQDIDEDKEQSFIHNLTKIQGKTSTKPQKQKQSVLRGEYKTSDRPPAYYDDQIFAAKDDEKFDLQRERYDSNETSKFRGGSTLTKAQQYPPTLKFHNVVYDLVKII